MSAVNEQDPAPRFIYSEDEFCKQTGLSKTTAWRLRKSGKLGFCQLTSTKIGYRPEDITEFLDSIRKPAKGASKGAQEQESE